MILLVTLVAAFFAFTTGYGIGWLDGFRRGIAPRPTQEEREDE